MAEKKKELKPFKTAAGAVQFMRNFDLDNMVESSREEIDKMISIFEKENEKLGPEKFKEKYAGQSLSQVKEKLGAMRVAQIAEGFRQKFGDTESAKTLDEIEKSRLDLAKRLGKKRKSGNSRGGLTRTGHTDLRKTGLFR